MKNRTRSTVVIVGAAAVIFAIVLLGVILIYKYFAPSSEQKDLNSLFKLQKEEVALIIDDKLLEERAKKIDNGIYIPADIAAAYMDKRLYVDTVEKKLCYAARDNVIIAKADAKEYTIGRQSHSVSHPVLKIDSQQFYISFSFIKEHASCYYKEYKNPSRIVIMSDREAKYTFAVLNSDTRVRTGPGRNTHI